MELFFRTPKLGKPPLGTRSQLQDKGNSSVHSAFSSRLFFSIPSSTRTLRPFPTMHRPRHGRPSTWGRGARWSDLGLDLNESEPRLGFTRQGRCGFPQPRSRIRPSLASGESSLLLASFGRFQGRRIMALNPLIRISASGSVSRRGSR